MHPVIHYGQIQAFLHDPSTAPLMPYLGLFAVLAIVLLAVVTREAMAK